MHRKKIQLRERVNKSNDTKCKIIYKVSYDNLCLSKIEHQVIVESEGRVVEI